jgi:pyruvate/2-oxoglutarate/acetoin dehydrogenase E1 component
MKLSFSQALNKALSDELAADPSVILLGEDIGAAGGSFAVTRGLQATYGDRRVVDTPIAEAAIVGAAVGAAMSGLRPVVEIMFMDFITLAMDAIVNQAAKARFMFGGAFTVPLVVRAPHGGGVGAGPQHSQCLEAWFAHVPGLKVVCPSEPVTGYALLRAAIRDPNPVIFVENKRLYGMKVEFPEPPARLSLGEAIVRRAGDDLTLVSYGAMVHQALEAASGLSEEGIEIEVIDLATLQPWDEATVLASVQRTGRLLVAHEAVEAFGIGAEIAARMAQIAHYSLKAPITRLGAEFVPTPFAPQLEAAAIPGAARIAQECRSIIKGRVSE